MGIVLCENKTQSETVSVLWCGLRLREKDIEHINQSIAEIPKKTNKMYDRMDMIILGSSALVIGY